MSLPTSEIAYQTAHLADDRQANLIVSSALCLAFAYMAVALRFASRRVARNTIGPDDYAILAGLFFNSTHVASVIVCVHYGLGRHLIRVTNFSAFEKALLASEILYLPAIFSTKLSILLLYKRLFPVRPFVVVLYITGAFVAAYSLTAAMVNLLQCLPVNSVWNPAVKPRCVNLGLELLIFSSINVVTDFVILVLPMPLVWRLHTTTARKAQVSGLFLLGAFVCGVSIFRATTVSKVSIVDGSWVATDAAIWSIVETCIAVVSACLPTLRPLWLDCAGRRNLAGKSDPIYPLSNYGDTKGRTGGLRIQKRDVEQDTGETDEQTLVAGDSGLGSGNSKHQGYLG